MSPLEKAALRLFWTSEHLDPSEASDGADEAMWGAEWPPALSERNRQFWRLCVRAALEALMEPGPDVIEAGVQADIPGGRWGEPTFRESSVNENDVPVIWQAMLRKVLS